MHEGMYVDLHKGAQDCMARYTAGHLGAIIQDLLPPAPPPNAGSASLESGRKFWNMNRFTMML